MQNMQNWILQYLLHFCVYYATIVADSAIELDEICLSHAYIFCLLAGVALLFEPLSVYALSTSLDVLPRSTENESNISELPLDNTPSTDVKENSDNLDWLWNILGSGLVCAVITRALDYFKEKKIRLLSAADALFAAFSAAFSDDFLERDDSQWSVFQHRYRHFCENQTIIFHSTIAIIGL